MQSAPLVLTLSVIVAIGPAIVCYLARWWLDRGAIVPPWLFPVLMVAGAASGLFFALIGYPRVEAIFVAAWGAPVQSGGLLMGAVLVPAAEEIGKAFVLLPFALSRWYRGPVDGLIYGFAAGAGFACLENFAYFAQAWSLHGEGAWLMTVITRAVPSVVIHGGATASIGAFIGLAIFDRRPLVVLAAPICGFVTALLVHGIWNWLVMTGSRIDDPRFTQAAVVALLLYFVLGLIALMTTVRYEARGMRPSLEREVAEGHITPDERDAVLKRRLRRVTARWLAPQTDRRRMIGALINLGLVASRSARDGRGHARLERARARVARTRGALRR